MRNAAQIGVLAIANKGGGVTASTDCPIDFKPERWASSGGGAAERIRIIRNGARLGRDQGTIDWERPAPSQDGPILIPALRAGDMIEVDFRFSGAGQSRCALFGWAPRESTPEGYDLRASVEDASRRLDEALARLREKVPPPLGRTWAISAAGTVGLFPLGEGGDE